VYFLVTDNHSIIVHHINDDQPDRIIENISVGNNSLFFNKPHGIAVHPFLRHIFVVDTGNYRIQILNADFSFNDSFERQISISKGQFMEPAYIAFDKEGFVYVTDSLRHCVLKFFTNGTFIDDFGSFGSFPGQLNKPKGIVIDSHGAVYVADTGNSRISIIDTSGNFIHYIASIHNGKKYIYPSALAIDHEDDLYIPDNSI
jgi:tripartite motif-containing protein 2/3/tripartite motif-containing protein 71